MTCIKVKDHYTFGDNCYVANLVNDDKMDFYCPICKNKVIVKLKFNNRLRIPKYDLPVQCDCCKKIWDIYLER